MAKARLDEKVTVRGIVFLILTILGLFGLFVLMVNFCDDKVPATYEQVWNALEEHNCDANDSTEQYLEAYPSIGLKYVISARDTDFLFDYYEFESTDDAYGAYQRLNAGINENFSRDSVETGADLRNYIIHTYLYNNEYYYLMKVDNTVLYCESSEANKDLVNDIAYSLGYYD